MKNEILERQILAELRRGPRAGGQLAIALSQDPNAVRYALYDLMDAGKVSQCIDGYRYELTGGQSPGPSDGGEAA